MLEQHLTSLEAKLAADLSDVRCPLLSSSINDMEVELATLDDTTGGQKVRRVTTQGRISGGVT